ncbi:MocR-like pyridoxine biosynthesis transcription factor PdxR [Variovorax sp. PBL-E5]|uniref:MocR-like pyridoxine biosynthesis transcription factor PdxR n=1 Tax=Variovorax sp. PBL-E5 TaxID=434014 RepID=UPI001318D891|nr:PLP-dependent aminotransferase family protein [Variovorax sp. PBL-E5]VTU22339.1 HTH-type transcriptional regulatory protein GabR [Variovorax sp. PBL-E5]
MRSLVGDLLLARLAQSSTAPARGALNRRLCECIRGAIHDGSLEAGSRLPASRELARELGFSRNTATFVYEQLVAEGYLRAVVGSGTYVRERMPDAAPLAPAPRVCGMPPRRPALSQRGFAAIDQAQASTRQWGAFMPGLPDVTRFPQRQFAGIASRLARKMSPSLMTYSTGGGHAALRESIAQYLRQARSVVCEPQQIIVTEGVQQALDLVVRLLGDAGDAAWVEEPGYWGIRSVLAINGIRMLPVRVDVEGMQLPHAEGRENARFAFVTPSHQYPLGPIMSMARRFDLIDHAMRQGMWIVEDDYDSEFRFTGRPVPSLQGLAPDGPVIYVGTFSKTLYPGLRIAYAVVPSDLCERFHVAHSEFYRGGHLLTQAALAEFMSQGAYAAHIRRMRQIYAARRSMLVSLVERWLGREWIHPLDTEAGLHVVLTLPDAVDDLAIERELLAGGVIARALSRYFVQAPRERGLVLGFASVPEGEMLRPFERLVQVLRARKRK